MKYINIMNIHSEKQFLKEFIDNLDNENKKSIKKKRYKLERSINEL